MSLGILTPGSASGTGHRPQHIPADAHQWCRSEIRTVAWALRWNHGVTDAHSGLAIGFDTWWAWAVLAVGMRLHAHVPFPQQADRWTPAQQREWRELLAAATTVTHYAVGLLHARNDGLIAAGSAIVALWDPAKTTGGTAGTVAKAKRRGLPIIHINPIARTVELIEGAS